MANIIQIRRDTAANWTSVNPILANAEIGYETDSKKFKFGDGVNGWTSLTYSTVDLTGYLQNTDIDTLAKLNAIISDATLIDTNDPRLSDDRNVADDSVTVAKLHDSLKKVDNVLTEVGTEGEALYDTPGSFSWVCPVGVTSVSVVCIGGGGGGHVFTSYSKGGNGGALGYKNNIPVVPGNSYNVEVGAAGLKCPTSTSTNNATDGGQSYFIDAVTVQASGGIKGGYNQAQQARATYVGDGGGQGGIVLGSGTANQYARGGGGAGGYSGNGGDASSALYSNGTAGLGGGGGGGGAAGSSACAGGGGGVDVYGEGASGVGGTGSSADVTIRAGGGSGGEDGGLMTDTDRNGGAIGGLYGGGGGAADGTVGENGDGGGGAVRILWGAGRSFPSTNVGLSAPKVMTVDWNAGIGFSGVTTATVNLEFLNPIAGKTITVKLTGGNAVNFPTGVDVDDVAGFVADGENYLQFYCVDTTTPKYITTVKSYE